MKVMTDEEIIRQHDQGVRARARIELRIVNQIIATAAEKGYRLKVREYEVDGTTEYDVKTAVFDLDLATLLVYDGHKRIGTVLLVFGNDGYDVISDYSDSTKIEAFLADANKLADDILEGRA
jgi:hypothetical protein